MKEMSVGRCEKIQVDEGGDKGAAVVFIWCREEEKEP